MALNRLDCREVLSAFQSKERVKTCYLANSAKQLYTLPLLKIDPAARTVELKAPRGRSAPVDGDRTWTLTFRDRKGAYRAVSNQMVVRASSLFFVLEETVHFLARRKHIRLTAESRNPIAIAFHQRGKRRQGILVDFNTRGIGILIPQKIEFAVDEPLTEGSFELRSQRVSFEKARIVHVAHLESGTRLGLEFQELSPSREQAIHAAFDAWCFSQKASFPVADEG